MKRWVAPLVGLALTTIFVLFLMSLPGAPPKSPWHLTQTSWISYAKDTSPAAQVITPLKPYVLERDRDHAKVQAFKITNHVNNNPHEETIISYLVIAQMPRDSMYFYGQDKDVSNYTQTFDFSGFFNMDIVVYINNQTDQMTVDP